MKHVIWFLTGLLPEERSYEHFGLLNELRAVPWSPAQGTVICCSWLAHLLTTSAVFAKQASLWYDYVPYAAKAGYTCPGGSSYAPNDVPLKFDCRLWKASQLHSQAHCSVQSRLLSRLGFLQLQQGLELIILTIIQRWRQPKRPFDSTFLWHFRSLAPSLLARHHTQYYIDPRWTGHGRQWLLLPHEPRWQKSLGQSGGSGN